MIKSIENILNSLNYAPFKNKIATQYEPHTRKYQLCIETTIGDITAQGFINDHFICCILNDANMRPTHMDGLFQMYNTPKTANQSPIILSDMDRLKFSKNASVRKYIIDTIQNNMIEIVGLYTKMAFESKSI
jgi:hypothetical protein